MGLTVLTLQPYTCNYSQVKSYKERHHLLAHPLRGKEPRLQHLRLLGLPALPLTSMFPSDRLVQGEFPLIGCGLATCPKEVIQPSQLQDFSDGNYRTI